MIAAGPGAAQARRVPDRNPTLSQPDNPARGILLMAAAFFVFAGSDGMVKHLVATVPPLEIVWFRYLTFTLILLVAIARTGWRHGFRTNRPGLHVARAGLQVVTNALITVSFAVMPLADTVALGLTGPLFVTAMSVVLLGEFVGWRRWSAVLVGLAGTLIIVRPGTPSFEPASLLVLTGTATGALSFVLTRRMSGEGALTLLAWAAVVGLAGSTPFALAVWRTPTTIEVGLLALNGAANLFAQWLAVRAVLIAPASVVAPVHYSHIVWATLISIVAFGVWPDAWTFAGAGVITASGLYVWWRERVRHAQPSALANHATTRLNDRPPGGDT